MRPKRRHLVHELMCREYGVKCTWWASMQALRYAVFGPRRKWKNIFQTKENSLLELSGDLMWITRSADHLRYSCNVMKRICGDGRVMTLYTSDLHPRPMEVAVYEIPDPHFRASIPQQEYQPVMFTLRKGGVLTRHNLETGKFYNSIFLSHLPCNSLSVSFLSDILIVKSPNFKFHHRAECLFRFHAFHMHPFKWLAKFDIDGSVFPEKEHKRRYGKLRNAEIHDDMLIVMTEKNYSLIYDAQEIMKEKMVSSIHGVEDFASNHLELVEKAPPLLFVTLAHMDILGLGACPWTYIRAVSDSVLEVRDLATEELLNGGRVMWRDRNDIQISPDYLMFHPDDSSRVIHVRTSEIRILTIREREGKRTLEEEFGYPERGRITKTVEAAKYSRSGRLIKTKFELDDSLNRAIVFNVETDLRVLIILEARRDDEHNCTKLLKVTFYDSLSYDLLHEMNLSVKVDGDIETNRLSISMDRDILNIVSHKGSQHTILVYRLKEMMEDDTDVRRMKSKRRACDNAGSSYREDESESGDGPQNEIPKKVIRKSLRTAVVERRTERRGTNKRRGKRTATNNTSNESDHTDSDEWVP
nr:DDB1- and CUL4-associated factor 17-like [Procambarus clarkii]